MGRKFQWRRLFSASRAVPRSARPIVESVEPRRLMSVVHHSTHFADGNFLPANWSISMTNVGGGGTQTASRSIKKGHPGAYRVIYNTVYASGSGSVDYGFNAYAKGSYNPAVKGAITSINYSEDNILLAGFGQGQASGPAFVQNGVLYIAEIFVTPNAKWTHQVKNNLKLADFVEASDLKTHPDFSQTAAPMQFGFFRANSAGIPGYSITAGIDNFSLTIKSAKTK